MSEESIKIIDKPKAGVADGAHLAARVILSSIPGFGGAAKELFNYVIAPPLAKRQVEWMDSIAIRLTELEQQVADFKIEPLSNNENFISSVFYATTIAIRSHQEEKLEALRNAVLNTAITGKVEDNLSHMFLNCIDDLTPLHLLVLKYFESPTEWLKKKGTSIPDYVAGGAMTIFDHAFPELAGNRDLTKQIVSDLSVRGLAFDWDSMNVMVGKNGMVASRITPLGRQFLAFISSPLK